MIGNFRAYTDWILRSFKTLELRILLVGDDDSGKTTLLNQWYHQKFVDLPPSYMGNYRGGFEVQTVEYPQKCRWTI
jgi:GTPase SAR1 family protein